MNINIWVVWVEIIRRSFGGNLADLLAFFFIFVDIHVCICWNFNLYLLKFVFVFMCCEGSGWRSSGGALVGVWQMQNSFGLFLHARYHLFCQMIIGHINVHKYKSKCKQIHATSKEIWSNQTSYTHTAICICISSLFDVQLSAALKALKTVPSKIQWRWLEAFVPTEMSRRHQNDPPLCLPPIVCLFYFTRHPVVPCIATAIPCIAHTQTCTQPNTAVLPPCNTLSCHCYTLCATKTMHTTLNT